MKKTAVFLDLDGTLWEWGVVPDSAREAIRRAQTAGADAFLVGTALMRAERPGEKLKELTTNN